jgi:hypothetical protein
MHISKEKGFAHVYLILAIVVILAVGAIGWRIFDKKQQGEKSAQLQSQQEAEGETIAKLSAEEQEKLKAKNGDIPPTAENAPAVATTKETPPKPVDNTTKGAVTQTQKATAAPSLSESSTPTAAPAPTTPSAPTVLRPTAEFCAQKNGASFTNVWFTGTGTYTYDGYAWENGYSYSLPRISKTETGTPLRNYDTMQIFDVVEYGTQPAWAICSKAGYVMVYYTVPNSPYTFNVLAEYGHLSLQQP